jgi:multidrug efflux system membrane fusion protein
VFVAPAVDELTAAVPIRVAAPGAALRPGEFLQLHIVADEHADTFVVPEAAVVNGVDGPGVHVVIGEEAHRVPVTVGFRDRGKVEISGPGIGDGTRIVTTDAYGLPDTVRVKPIVEAR